MPRAPLFRWPFTGAHLSEAEAAELAAELRRADLPASATEAEYASLMQRLRERLRWPVQSETEAEDA